MNKLRFSFMNILPKVIIDRLPSVFWVSAVNNDRVKEWH